MKKDVETRKTNQSEMKATLTEMKNNLQGINSKVDEAENQISDLECKEAKNTQSEQQKGKRILKNEDSVRSLWDHSSIRITGPLGGESEQEIENLFEK